MEEEIAGLKQKLARHEERILELIQENEHDKKQQEVMRTMLDKAKSEQLLTSKSTRVCLFCLFEDNMITNYY